MFVSFSLSGGNFQSQNRGGGMTRTPRLPRLVRPTLRNRSQSPALLSIGKEIR